MKSWTETFKQFDRSIGKWVTRSIERTLTPKKDQTKMRQIKKVEPFCKSIFEK